MRIRYTKQSAGEAGCFAPGDVREVPDALAKRLMAAGAALPLDIPYRAAVVEPREECAVAATPEPNPKPKRRRRRAQ